MPARCKANLRAYCSQKLEIDDLSYNLRIPMAYVPAYMGNCTKSCDQASGLLDDEEKKQPGNSHGGQDPAQETNTAMD